MRSTAVKDYVSLIFERKEIALSIIDTFEELGGWAILYPPRTEEKLEQFLLIYNKLTRFKEIDELLYRFENPIEETFPINEEDPNIDEPVYRGRKRRHHHFEDIPTEDEENQEPNIPNEEPIEPSENEPNGEENPTDQNENQELNENDTTIDISRVARIGKGLIVSEDGTLSIDLEEVLDDTDLVDEDETLDTINRILNETELYPSIDNEQELSGESQAPSEETEPTSEAPDPVDDNIENYSQLEGI